MQVIKFHIVKKYIESFKSVLARLFFWFKTLNRVCDLNKFTSRMLTRVNVSEILLSFLFLVHGIDDRLSFCVIPSPQIVDLHFHLVIQVRHLIRELVNRQMLQLKMIEKKISFHL
jgi:hypothetical protein